MDAPKFEWLINCGRLFMPSADRLGDSLEGSTPPGELEWWQRESERAETDEMRRVIEHNRSFLSRMAKQIRINHYVGCWHVNQHENHAMWGCYTKQPESVAIKTTYSTFRDLLPKYVEVGLVRYIDYSTERLPTMNMFEYIMRKDAYYRFEQEVRAVAFPPAVEELRLADFRANLFESETTKAFLVYAPQIDTKKLIQGVVLHPDSPATHIAAVRALCAKHGLPVPELSRRTREPVF
jgi:hypothetical protein